MKITRCEDGYKIVPLTSDSERHLVWLMDLLTSDPVTNQEPLDSLDQSKAASV